MTTYNCLCCGAVCKTGHSKLNKYCNNLCQREHQRQETYQRLLKGDLKDRAVIRRILVWKNGHKCSCCGLSEWMGQPIPLELDHTDGDASNNSMENLAVICPNCHGITPTWKGRNKGNGRKARGLALS